MGENRPQGALLSYYVAAPEKGKKAKVEVLDAAGEVIRTLYHQPDTGINRFTWDLTRRGVRYPTRPKPDNPEYEAGGREVMPGTYTVRITYGEHSSETVVEVQMDPKIPLTQNQLAQKAELLDDFAALTAKVTERADRIRQAQSDLERVQNLAKAHEHEELMKQGEVHQKELEKLMEIITGPQDVQGIYRDPEALTSILSTPDRLLQGMLFAPTPSQRIAIDNAQDEIMPKLKTIDAYFSGPWAGLKEKVAQANLSVMK